MDGKITVREWIKKYNNGDFNSTDIDIQIDAGWYDWFCKDKALLGRLNKMANIIKNIKNDFILDNYYVWFKNNCPCFAPLYDVFRFEPIDDKLRNKLSFGISCNDKRNDTKYEIFTARTLYATEYKTSNKKELLNNIDTLAKELQKKE